MSHRSSPSSSSANRQLSYNTSETRTLIQHQANDIPNTQAATSISKSYQTTPLLPRQISEETEKSDYNHNLSPTATENQKSNETQKPTLKSKVSDIPDSKYSQNYLCTLIQPFFHACLFTALFSMALLWSDIIELKL